jgi:putative phosphoribosyl transferase
VPVAPQDVCAALRNEADDVACLLTPADFRSVGTWYDDFSQTSDDEVRALLQRARQPPPAPPPDTIRVLTGAASDYDPLVSSPPRRASS